MNSQPLFPRLERRYLEHRAERKDFKVNGRLHKWLPLDILPVTEEDVRAALRRKPFIVDFGCMGNDSIERDWARLQKFSYFDSAPIREQETFQPWELDAGNIEGIQFAAAWLASHVPMFSLTKTAPNGYWCWEWATPQVRSTYSLKHIMEQDTDKYVSNGEMILACEVVGAPWVPSIPNPPVGLDASLYDVIKDRAYRIA